MLLAMVFCLFKLSFFSELPIFLVDDGVFWQVWLEICNL